MLKKGDKSCKIDTLKLTKVREDTMDKKTLIIVGAGFGGIHLAQSLGKSKNLKVIMIDRRNHHLFQPLLYQVATAGLSPAEIATPIRSRIGMNKNTEVILGEVTDIHLENKTLLISIDGKLSSLSYDYLVLACGANHQYFGNDAWEEHAPGLKTLEQAIEIRRRILTAFELAEREPNEKRRQELLTFAIIGGGPTGVELAGALAEIKQLFVGREFSRITPEMTKIALIEAMPRLLTSFSEDLSEKTRLDLEDLGVTVMTNTKVKNITHEGVEIEQEGRTSFIATSTTMWAAGNKASILNQKLGAELDRQGRVMVNSDCSLPHHPEVFVIGDQAHFKGKDGQPLAPLAPVAIQQAKYLAKKFLKGNTNAFSYFDKGTMATIGRKKAIAEVPFFKKKLKFTDFFAWLMWLFIHLIFLIDFKNRVFVFWQWAWAYFTYKRGSRIITDYNWKLKP